MDSCHLVAPDVSAENAEKEAERMLNWLKQQGIIDPDYQLIEDDEAIYRPTPEYKQPILYIIDDKIVPTQLPEHILKNYLTITTQRTVFHAGGNGLGIYCPVCKNEQSKQSEDWSDAVTAWYEGNPHDLSCVNCDYRAPIGDWHYDPTWAFGELGFSFHSWDMSDAFIQQFTKAFGGRIIDVYQHDWASSPDYTD
ncbi:hypothetical protein QVM86_13595 [Providencia stuartii]|nr:hypothetical protein [Providencia stuartii]